MKSALRRNGPNSGTKRLRFFGLLGFAIGIVTVIIMAFTAPQLRAYEELPGQPHPEPLLNEESTDENAEE